MKDKQILYTIDEKTVSILIEKALDGHASSIQVLAGYLKRAEEALIQNVLPRAVYHQQNKREYVSITKTPDAPNTCATLLAVTSFCLLCGRPDVTVTVTDLLNIRKFIGESKHYQPDPKWPFTKEQMKLSS